MYQQGEDLDIVFRRTAPEKVLQSLRSFNAIDLKGGGVNADAYPDTAYDHYSLLNLPEYSRTELEMRAEHMRESMKEIKGGGVFSLLVLYADELFCYDGCHIRCKRDHILDWQTVYLRLGQDIFTTAWLAWRDRHDTSDSLAKHKFTWPAVLKTDDRQLNALLESGLAENHFHLHGSTQSFPLSWACLMNHPMSIHAYLHHNPRFQTRLSYHAAGGSEDNVMDMESYILYAAMIRALLFERCLGLLDGHGANDGGSSAGTRFGRCEGLLLEGGGKESGTNDGDKDIRTQFGIFDRLPLAGEIKNHTEMLREGYGRKYRQLNGRKVCLDYAVCSRFYRVDEEENNRLLAGERSFLYQCFRRCFTGKFTKWEASLFYLYLLIKSNFRGELIQVNGRNGFRNFADYQDRKNLFYEKYDEYWTESLRLSICSGIKENHLVSLEARIMPKPSAEEIKESIDGLDKRIAFPSRTVDPFSDRQKAAEDRLPYFYVLHFPKKPFDHAEYQNRELFLLPRNYRTRRIARKQAIAISRYMRRYDVEDQRVWGIDACSMEIGCRPETFATEFRYLKACSRDNMEAPWYGKGEGKHQPIGMTYHVGEDFLDIADGLRALDETLLFLGFEKGDRLGHALVLGIDPEEYYRTKKGQVFLRKQDYLDNLVWLLYRSLELGVVIEENHRAAIREEAIELLDEIYVSRGKAAYRTGKLGGRGLSDASLTQYHGDGRDMLEDKDALYAGDLLQLYYHSWQLRGDYPGLYESGQYVPERKLKEEEYDQYKIAEGMGKKLRAGAGKLDVYRRNGDIAKLYYFYHFDSEVKDKGYQVVGYKIEKWYVKAMADMQRAMRMEVYQRGICVECNPSSNVLIGTFKTYDRHPLMIFNNHLLSNDDHLKLQASINTDDLGVFDTSLENEYAVMLHAICSSRHESGNYNDIAVYEYLEHLRLNGIRMAFRRDGQ